MKQISWWLVGPEYWWADVLDEEGSIIKQADGETGLDEFGSLADAKRIAKAQVGILAYAHDVAHSNVCFDEHETEQYSEYFKKREAQT